MCAALHDTGTGDQRSPVKLLHSFQDFERPDPGYSTFVFGI